MKKYLVGLLCGGVMEDPDFHFESPYLVINAVSKKAAKDIYNKCTNASYYYGHVMCEIKNGQLINIDDNCSKSICKKAIDNCDVELIKRG